MLSIKNISNRTNIKISPKAYYYKSETYGKKKFLA